MAIWRGKQNKEWNERNKTFQQEWFLDHPLQKHPHFIQTEL